MKTIKILAYGGDDLIMLGKTDTLPANVVSIFNNSKGIWDTDVEEKYQYLDRPVDKNCRLFMRYYKHSQPGERALPYEVGFLLTREVYETAGNLQVLHEQLMQLSHDTLSKCWESSGELVLPIRPMAETQETPNTSLSLDAPRLLCGKSEFDAHLAEVGTSFISSNIDDWFTRLYLVVNPYKSVESANITVSRKWMECGQIKRLTKETNRRVSRTVKCIAICAGIVVTGGTCEYISKCRDYEEKITQLKKEIEDLLKENRELKNQLRQQAKQEYTAEP